MVGFSSISIVVHSNKINTEHIGYILQFSEKLQSMIIFFLSFSNITYINKTKNESSNFTQL